MSEKPNCTSTRHWCSYWNLIFIKNKIQFWHTVQHRYLSGRGGGVSSKIAITKLTWLQRKLQKNIEICPLTLRDNVYSKRTLLIAVSRCLSTKACSTAGRHFQIVHEPISLLEPTLPLCSLRCPFCRRASYDRSFTHVQLWHCPWKPLCRFPRTLKQS